MANGTPATPNDVWGQNEYYADRVGLSKGESVPLAPGGNTVNPARINKTLNIADKSLNKAHPLGNQGTTGF